MCVFALPSVSMKGLNLFQCQSTPGTYFPYLCQSDPRLHMVHMFKGWKHDLPISYQLASTVYSIIYVIFSHVHVFRVLVITPIVLDYYVASQDDYLLYCTVICMYMLGICFRP